MTTLNLPGCLKSIKYREEKINEPGYTLVGAPVDPDTFGEVRVGDFNQQWWRKFQRAKRISKFEPDGVASTSVLVVMDVAVIKSADINLYLPRR
uniref:MOSC domain-containing protein n=1 Tax=Echinococcus granulosus TaxID=6210 RepID=U6FU68_ECHGR|nr:hypothetical protein EgrG_002070800 [Echinococcus granulosus]